MYPSRNPYQNEIIVKNTSDLMGQIDSSKVYLLDGNIDLGDDFIDVPETGITVVGFGSNVSGLSANGKIFGFTGAYSGRIKTIGIGLSSPSVFDVDGTGGPTQGAEISCVDTDFLFCDSLGDICGYRQGLWTNVGVILCEEGLTMSGTWSGGFASDTSIIVGGLPNGPLFKAGVDLVINGSFRSNMNAISLGVTEVFCDFSPSNITADAGFSMEGVRTGALATNPFPNMPSSSVKALFDNVKGVGTVDTYPGGEFILTADGTTTIAAQNTLYQITATGTGSNLDWTQISNTNGIEFLSSETISATISGALSFSGGSNDQIGLQIRQWDASASAYVNIGPEYVATLNGGPAGSRAENVSFRGTATISLNDRIEIWIKNRSNSGDIVTLAGGDIFVSKR